MPEMMKVFIPKGVLDGPAIVRAVENALQGAALAVKVDFNATTTTWNDRPEFTIEKAPGRRVVSTDDKTYGFVNHGTAVRHAVMVGGFKPKSRHRYIGANKGFGGKVFVSKKINLPGIQAREFDLAIKDKWDQRLPEQLQRAIDTEVSRQNRSASNVV